MEVLIVHAHPEPKSFCSATKDAMVEAFLARGDSVTVSDLYAMHFDPVTSRKNFTSVADPDYFRVQAEEAHATAVNGFSAEIETEINKLLKADLLVFNFPLWWYGMPAIMKGWVDRVFAYKRIYASTQMFETGLGVGKRAFAALCTGTTEQAYGGRGLQPDLEIVLRPLQQGIFWFHGAGPLPPLVTYAPAQMSQDQRVEALAKVKAYVANLDALEPIGMPKTSEFQGTGGADKHRRFMVEIHRKAPPNDEYLSKLPAEAAAVERLKRSGRLKSLTIASPNEPVWTAWLHFRAEDKSVVEADLKSLPLYDFLDIRIHETL